MRYREVDDGLLNRGPIHKVNKRYRETVSV